MAKPQGWHLRPDGHAWKSVPIGTEKIRKSGEQRKLYWFVKVSDELCGGENHRKAALQWEKKHLLLWRQTYGEIPKGYRIIFLNGDTLDCRLENLYMISNRVNGLMRGYNLYSTDPEITKTSIKLCELIDVLKKQEKGE